MVLGALSAQGVESPGLAQGERMSDAFLRETDHQHAGIALAEACGCFCLRTNGPRMTYSTAGLPDVLIFLPRGKGILLWEVKRPGGKSSDRQTLVAAKATLSGIPYVTGTEEDLRSALELAGVLRG